MKKVFLFPVFLVLSVDAASSSSVTPDTRICRLDEKHDANGVSFSLLADSPVLSNAEIAQFGAAFSMDLASGLKETMSFNEAKRCLTVIFDRHETLVRDAVRERFRQEIIDSSAKGDSFGKQRPCLSSIFFAAALAKSGAKLRLVGISGNTCCTFFPEYTIESEGSNELSAAEQVVLAQEKELQELQSRIAGYSDLLKAAFSRPVPVESDSDASSSSSSEEEE